MERQEGDWLAETDELVGEASFVQRILQKTYQSTTLSSETCALISGGSRVRRILESTALLARRPSKFKARKEKNRAPLGRRRRPSMIDCIARVMRRSLSVLST
jgi:hypothetical protein